MHFNIVLLVLCSFLASLYAFEIYVSPTADLGGVGSEANPTSLLKGQALARDFLRKTDHSESVTIYLRSGRYEIDRTFHLTDEDSGSTYAKHPKDQDPPVIFGGKTVTGWAKNASNDNIWNAKIDGVGASWYPKQFFVNGGRRWRAKLPSIEDNYYWTSQLSPTDMEKNTWGFNVDPKDNIREYSNLNDVNVIVFHEWTASRHQIQNVSNGAIYFVNPFGLLSAEMDASNMSGHRYFVENAIEALDEAGEWYLDRNTGIISYYAMLGEDMTALDSWVSNIDVVLALNGNSSESPIKNVQLQGTIVEGGEWYCPDMPQPCEAQAADFLNTSTILVTNAKNIQIENVTVGHTGSFGIWISEQSSGVAINDLRTTDLGTGGVRIGSGYDTNTNGHSVTNSYILDGGHVFYEGIGVLVQQSAYNNITHNEIGHFCYTGVSVGWVWGFTPSPSHHNLVEYNHIYDIGRNTLTDMGGVYTLGISDGTVVNNNLIHDVYSYNYGGWGIYPDEGSSNITWSNNIVYNTKSAGLHQHYGHDNIIVNNVFAMNGWADGAIRTDPGDRTNSLNFEKNIVYVTNATLFNGDWDYVTTWPFHEFHFDDNLYFSTSNSYVFGPGKNFTEWQQSGQDQNSIYGKDPMFTDLSAYNFEVQDGSPALKLGFQNIDMSTVGPQPPSSAQKNDPIMIIV